LSELEIPLPELPEVETTLRGIAPSLDKQVIDKIIVRNASLRWPVPDEVQKACGQQVTGLQRRAKYMLIEMESGGLLIHLGMSGSMRICRERVPLLRMCNENTIKKSVDKL
jgi:formamidopyrimidine-DNA glycosylase